MAKALSVAVTVHAGGRKTQAAASGLDRWLQLVAPARARGTVEIAVVSDRRMQSLNLEYRKKRVPTDVLSFPATAAGRRPADGFWGDIAIAAGVAARQARAEGHGLAVELRVLALHGLLHLLGYDHEVDKGLMGRVEDRLRKRGGLSSGLVARAVRTAAVAPQDASMTPLLLFLLLSAAIYIGTVTAAFSALMRLSLRIMAERSERGDALGPYLEDPRRLFVPARILLSAINILAAALFARVSGVDPKGFPVLVLAIFGLGLACEHLVPLLIVRKDPERVLDVLLPSFNAVERVLRPLTSMLLRVGTSSGRDRNGTGNGTEAPPSTPAATEPPPPSTDALPEGQAREMLRTLVDFRETMVREVSTPRPDIVAIDSEATIGQLRALFREQQYSRIPVYKETIDNIQGFVFVKDLITLKSDALPSDPIAPLMRPAHFVPETKRVPELLTEFQRNRVQSAIVVDEYGSTAGLVTIEDLLEEIVGEIRDEYDVEADKVVDEGDGRFVFSGITHIEEMGLHLKVHVEPRGFETVGGYLMSHLGRVPTVGEKFDLDGLEVEVLEAERRRVTRVRIYKREPVTAEEGTPDR